MGKLEHMGTLMASARCEGELGGAGKRKEDVWLRLAGVSTSEPL